MTQTIVNGGNATQQNQYTGPENEITVDQSNRELRLHDGATQGGHRIPSRDSNDQRYQEKIAELDGLANFGASQRGFLVRLGAADYRIRALTGNPANITVTYGDAYDQNPVISLAEVITSEHTWQGQQVFEEVVEFEAGINADTFGTHTGGVEGDVIGDVTGALTGPSAGTHTGPQIGSVDVRGQTLQLDDGQIPAGKISGLTDETIPLGCIVLWSGDTSDIPDGWALCDGDNGTPNLVGMFIVGAGADPAPGATGGTTSHSHTINIDAAGTHNHTVTVDNHTLDISEIPAHQHGSGVTDNSQTDVFNHTAIGASPTTGNSVESNSADGIYEGQTTSVGGGGGHNHTGSSGNAGSHTHTVGSETADHIPPFYALCFIMRVS